MGVLPLTLWIKGPIGFVKESPSLLATLRETDEPIFMSLSGNFGHMTKNDLEHFRGVMINLLDSGSIFLFYATVFVSNIIAKQMNGFSYHCHDMSRTTQEIINYTVSCLARLFHNLLSMSGGMSVSNIMVKLINGFSWNVQDGSAITQETIWIILRTLYLIASIRDLIIYFRDTCR